MKKTILRNKTLILFASLLNILLFTGNNTVLSQVSRSSYFIEQLPSSNVLNPAFHPEYKFYVNLPVLSTFYLGFESPFSFDDLTSEWPGGDSLFINREGILKVLNSNNYFSFELYNELGRFGVGAGKHYFHASIAKKFSTKFSFQKDLIALLLFGNASPQFLGKNLEINNTGLNMTSYHEFALGYSYDVIPQLTIGTKLKYLNGAFNIWTERTDFRFYTNPEPNYPITASMDVLINTSSTISSFDNLIDQIIEYKWFDLTQNHGFGFDLGLEYKPRDDIQVSASVVDLGWIKWKENVKNFVSENPNTDFNFEGFDLLDLFENGEFVDSLDVLDTLTSEFNLIETANSYTSSLNPKVYAGATWSFTPRNDLGGLVRIDIAENRLQPSVTLNYLHRFGKILSVYGNYTLMINNFANIGLGFVAKFGPFQMYILNDIAYSIVNSREAKNYNFHLGINFLFGNMNKVEEDPELIEKIE